MLANIQHSPFARLSNSCRDVTGSGPWPRDFIRSHSHGALLHWRRCRSSHPRRGVTLLSIDRCASTAARFDPHRRWQQITSRCRSLRAGDIFNTTVEMTSSKRTENTPNNWTATRHDVIDNQCADREGLAHFCFENLGQISKNLIVL